MGAGYDHAAFGYDARHGDRVSVERFEIIEKPMLRAAAGAACVLDLGCGTGRVLGRLAGRPDGCPVGVDISRQMLRAARARGLPVARADAHALPFGDAAFDAVVAAKGTFRYLDYPRALAECARVLRPGGRLAIHHYAARTWSVRAWAGRGSSPAGAGVGTVGAADALHLADPGELAEPAADVGLVLERTYLWRAIRVRPWAVRVPAWPKNRLWNHCVLLFCRR